MGAVGATPPCLPYRVIHLDDLLLATKQQHLQQIEVTTPDGNSEEKLETPLSRHILQLDHTCVLAQCAKIRFKAEKRHVAVQEVDFLGRQNH